jgi:hypothetical protein
MRESNTSTNRKTTAFLVANFLEFWSVYDGCSQVLLKFTTSCEGVDSPILHSCFCGFFAVQIETFAVFIILL